MLNFSAIPQHHRRLIWIGAAVLGACVVSGTLYAISSRDPHTDPDSKVYELAPSDVLAVQPAPLSRTLHLSGSLQPLRHAVIKSHSAGDVIEVRVQEGDRVHAGELLVRIDPRNLQAELDAQSAALRKAQADLVLASKNRDNSVTLLKQKLISQNSFDQTEAAYASSAANVDAAKAQVRLAQIALDNSAVRADFSGVVAARSVQVGERVMPDSPLVSLVDLSTMQLEALVPVSDVPSIKVGQEAHFTVDGFGKREFAGKVDRISPQAQQGTRSLTVYITVPNTDRALKGGMFADGDLVVAQTGPVLAVPSRAIRHDAAQAYVLVLDEGVVAKRNVETGERFEGRDLVVVHSGLDAATRVIVAPDTTLKPGNRAKLVAAG